MPVPADLRHNIDTNIDTNIVTANIETTIIIRFVK